MSELVIPAQPTGPMAPETPKSEEGKGGEELLAGKFRTQDDLIKAYKELESKLGQPKPEDTPAVKSEEKPTEAKLDEQADPAAQALQVAGLDMADFSAEYSKAGKLSDASYQKLEAAGFSKDVVDTYIEGMRAKTGASEAVAQAAEAQSEVLVGEVFKTVGGEEAYTRMVQWASKNLPAQEQAAYDRIVNSGDKDSILWAVNGLKAKYDTAVGVDPDLVSGNAVGESKDVFRSTQEVVAAMKDTRYGKDPAYTQDVIQRLGRSSVFK